jgi:hypothetical protein
LSTLLIKSGLALWGHDGVTLFYKIFDAVVSRQVKVKPRLLHFAVSELDEFCVFYALADRLIDGATKEDVTDPSTHAHIRPAPTLSPFLDLETNP